MQDQTFSVKWLDNDEANPTVLLGGQFTVYHINDFRSTLDEAVSKSHEKLFVDMENLEFIDSLGIGVLIFYFNHLKKNGIEMLIKRPSQSIREILRLTSLDRVMPILD